MSILSPEQNHDFTQQMIAQDEQAPKSKLDASALANQLLSEYKEAEAYRQLTHERWV